MKTPKELAEKICVECIDAPGPNMFFDHDAVADLIEADRRETERLCAERAAAWLHEASYHGYPVLGADLVSLRTAITSPAKEDSHE